MKLVYVSSSTIPSRSANSIHVMKMCGALSRLIDDVVLISQNIKSNKIHSKLDCYAYYDVKPSFKVLEFPASKRKLLGVPLYSISVLLYVLFSRADLVYSRNVFSAYLIARFGFKVIFESHAPVVPEDPSSTWFSKVKRRVFNSLAKSKNLVGFVVITKALARHYMDNYPFLEEKLIIAPDGADAFTLRETSNIDLNSHGAKLKVGYIGHLYRGKGIELVREVAKITPDVQFHIIGGLEKDIDYWAKRCQKNENITFHGYVPHGLIRCYMNELDVLLLPNQEYVDSFGAGQNIAKWTSPLKAFEYMSSGKPIIASRLPVLEEVFTDDVNAILCDHNSPQQWRDAILSIIENPACSQRLGGNAKQEFLQKYTWNKRAENILNEVAPTFAKMSDQL